MHAHENLLQNVVDVGRRKPRGAPRRAGGAPRARATRRGLPLRSSRVLLRAARGRAAARAAGLCALDGRRGHVVLGAGHALPDDGAALRARLDPHVLEAGFDEQRAQRVDVGGARDAAGQRLDALRQRSPASPPSPRRRRSRAGRRA